MMIQMNGLQERFDLSPLSSPRCPALPRLSHPVPAQASIEPVLSFIEPISAIEPRIAIHRQKPESERLTDGGAKASSTKIDQMLSFVAKEKASLAESKQSMRRVPTSSRSYKGKMKLPLEVYEARCLGKIAELDEKMLSCERRGPAWCRMHKQKLAL